MSLAPPCHTWDPRPCRQAADPQTVPWPRPPAAPCLWRLRWPPALCSGSRQIGAHLRPELLAKSGRSTKRSESLTSFHLIFYSFSIHFLFVFYSFLISQKVSGSPGQDAHLDVGTPHLQRQRRWMAARPGRASLAGLQGGGRRHRQTCTATYGWPGNLRWDGLRSHPTCHSYGALSFAWVVQVRRLKAPTPLRRPSKHTAGSRNSAL